MAHVLNLLRAGVRFRDWRRRRPFWGGILLIAAGIELLVAPAAQSLVLPIDLIIYAGIAGVSGTLIAVLLIALGVLSWLQPAQHVFFGLVGLMLALVSFVTSNFGGFAIGMLLGIVGGSLVFAWAPSVRRRPRGRRRKEAPDETVSDPRPGSGALSVIALPLAMAVALAAAAPVSAPGWPWDWFEPPGEEEEQPSDPPSDDPSDAPSADPSSDPSAEPSGGPTEPGTEPGAEEGTEEPEKPEDGEGEEDGEAEEGNPEDCALRTGESALATSEEEFLDAVLACQAAQEEGELPAVPVDEEYDCFRGSVRTSGLTANRLTMSGARYDGVVECPTADGARRYIRLTMDQADFLDAELWFEDAGTRMSLGLPTMDMTGQVEMHITRMHVRILGISLTFTPDFPPPLLLPYMIVTDVDVANPLASTDSMIIPNLNGQYGGGA